jgi:hypothetical protein
MQTCVQQPVFAYRGWPHSSASQALMRPVQQAVPARGVGVAQLDELFLL